MKEQLTPQEEEEFDKMIGIGKEMGFYEAQRQYAQIPVPDGLDGLVRRTIREQTVLREKKEKKAARKRSMRIAVRTLGTMAAALMLLMIPLNTNEAFARQMQRIPVFGKLAEVLTIRSYSYEENGVNVNVHMPEIVTTGGQEDGIAVADSGEEAELACYDGDMNGGALADTADAESATQLSAEVNAQIQMIVETYETDAKQRFAEYKEAFFATGGTEEEWGDRTNDVIVDYEVTYNEGDTLSLILTTSECWGVAQEEKYYYNLNMENGEYVTLQDLLGDNWVTICNESIDSQIEARLAADTEQVLSYWGYDEDEGDGYTSKFTTVNEETTFYINAQGNPVVCFAQYEIAPGYMGTQEFEIIE